MNEFDLHSIRRVCIMAARLLVKLEEWMIQMGKLDADKRTIIVFPK